MQRRITFTLLLAVFCMIALLGGLVLTQTASAQSSAQPGKAVVEMDRATLHEHLKAMGFHARGNRQRQDRQPRPALPHLSSLHFIIHS